MYWVICLTDNICVFTECVIFGEFSCNGLYLRLAIYYMCRLPDYTALKPLMSISLGINALAGAIVPHRGKLWRALNLVNWSIDDIGEFKFGDLNAVRHTRTCVNCYWWVLMAKLKTSPTFPAIQYVNNENNDVTCCILSISMFKGTC